MNKINYLISLTLIGVSAASCDSPKEPEKEIVKGDNDKELVIDKSDLTGTWYQPANPNYGNDNYISFDGHGYGQMAYAADQFTNPLVKPFDDNGAWILLDFVYTVDGNQLHIIPNEVVKSFTICVLDQSPSKLYLEFPSNYTIGRQTFEKIDDNPYWFTEYGPASEDLTIGLTGVYQEDGWANIYTVKKVNNWTVSIEERFPNRVTTGYLYWRDLHNPSFLGIRGVHKMGNYFSDDYEFEFREDGKLYLAKYSYDTGATKISD